VYKDIVLLACSKKHMNYCIAGIDIKNGEWVRIISNDAHIIEAVRAEDIRYEDGTFPQLLDIIRITVLEHRPNYYQPENYLFDEQYYWSKIGRVGSKQAIEKYATNKPEYLFFNTKKSVESEYIQQLKEAEKYSLIAIRPRNLKVQIKQWPEGKKIDMSFQYNGRSYDYLKVTDPQFIQKYIEHEEGSYFLGDDVLLVISLGENYYDAHYKLISGVIMA